jgi:hypothetical protein
MADAALEDLAQLLPHYIHDFIAFQPIFFANVHHRQQFL